MKKGVNKGFTLVELLAVIVLLGIITIIAVSAVGKNIEKSRKNATKANGISFVKAADEMSQLSKAEPVKYKKGFYNINELGIKLNGTLPDSGFVLINDYEVVGACLKYGKYTYSSCLENVNIIKEGICNQDEFECDASASNETEEYAFTNTDSLGNPIDPTPEKYIAPKTGTYQIELWGAEGGQALCNGVACTKYAGKGGYAKGLIHLNKGDKLYFYLGQKGQDAVLLSNTQPSYNGGGLSTSDGADDEAAGAGGGATDVRLVGGNWNDFNSLVSRIMVAGGGGGQAWRNRDGGAGGGINGVDSGSSKGATQTSGYQFGIGKDGNGAGSSDGVAGGGGGYWGGVSGNSSYTEVGSGGSGYISGHTGCVAIASASATTPKAGCANGTTDQSCSIHYSGKTFTETVLLDGTQSIPNYDGSSTMIGNSGNGHAKIFLVSEG